MRVGQGTVTYRTQAEHHHKPTGKELGQTKRPRSSSGGKSWENFTSLQHCNWEWLGKGLANWQGHVLPPAHMERLATTTPMGP